jgi:predicted  nucleic acid-binding Zn-ribbon protein
MQSDLERIVKVQGIDLRAAELRKEIAALPKHIAIIEKALESHQKKLDSDRAVLVANQRERKRLDGEIQEHQQKASKLRDQMLSAKTNEQYRAFQNEIGFCEGEIRKCEDRVLERMLESEALEQNVKAAEVALKQEKEQVEQETAAARTRTAEDEIQLDRLMAERRQVLAETAQSVVAVYEKLMKRSNIAVSDATSGRCSACQMEVRPQVMQQLRRRDQLLLCEVCKRILYYNPPVVVDAEAGGPVAYAEGGTRVDMT